MNQPHNHHTYGPSATASVILDIGGEIGALILETDATRLGEEIEISPVAQNGEPESPRTHSMVRERHAHQITYEAVYPDLRAGQYTIWRDQHTPSATVTVTGGQITRFSLH